MYWSTMSKLLARGTVEPPKSWKIWRYCHCFISHGTLENLSHGENMRKSFFSILCWDDHLKFQRKDVSLINNSTYRYIVGWFPDNFISDPGASSPARALQTWYWQTPANGGFNGKIIRICGNFPLPRLLTGRYVSCFDHESKRLTTRIERLVLTITSHSVLEFQRSDFKPQPWCKNKPSCNKVWLARNSISLRWENPL